MRTGVANLPLHSGKAPRWLFERMVGLAGCVAEMIAGEYGPETLLEKLSDPRWFQAFGCVLGFDWHSSGVTTTACGALKEGIKGRENDLGFFVAGGKGGASRKTPDQIRSLADAAAVSFDAESLVKASRLSAKVDNTALQDGYQLYHHVFCFTRSGAWGVVQQGMNDATSYARRYHWFSPRMPSFVNEPHSGIASQSQEKSALNMVAADSEASRLAVTQVVREGPRPLGAELAGAESLALPGHHWISAEDLSPRGFQKTLLQAYESQPSGFEDLLLVKGMGPKALRALVLVAELVHGAKPSWRDPAVYSFAHGGKDGIPHPVDRPLYDATVATLKHAIESSKLGNADKLAAIRRLASFWPDV